jgi:hypothetical protein
MSYGEAPFVEGKEVDAQSAYSPTAHDFGVAAIPSTSECASH